jgi:hypothetical protein
MSSCRRDDQWRRGQLARGSRGCEECGREVREFAKRHTIVVDVPAARPRFRAATCEFSWDDIVAGCGASRSTLGNDSSTVTRVASDASDTNSRRTRMTNESNTLADDLS